MQKPAFIFDLDMTLIDTSRLECWRNTGDWRSVERNMGLAQPFPLALPPHCLPNRLRELGHDVAIVTSSPERYAHELIERFDIPFDVLVSYGDTKEHKPEPEPILCALNSLGCPPENCYHIGDAKNDMQASFRAGVVPIGAAWGIRNPDEVAGYAPDLLLFSPETLLKHEKLNQYGYILEEELSRGDDFIVHNGSVFKWNDGVANIFALGRYFTVDDLRHSNSHLSKKILDLKENHTSTEKLARGLAGFVRFFVTAQATNAA